MTFQTLVQLPSPMDTTKEYQALRQKTSLLESAVQGDLASLSEKLRAKGVISEKTQARLKNESKSTQERARYLVVMVTDRVKSNPELYNVFVEVLHSSGIKVIQPLRPRNYVVRD